MTTNIGPLIDIYHAGGVVAGHTTMDLSESTGPLAFSRSPGQAALWQTIPPPYPCTVRPVAWYPRLSTNIRTNIHGGK